MKKVYFIYLGSLFFAGIINAKPVTQQKAQTVATNFYSRNFKGITPNLTLAYTGFSSHGQPAYYVYNVNTKDGFVIVAAEDAVHPILGYSGKGQYVIPRGENNFSWWMNCRKKEIEYARAKNITASADIANEWTGYTSNTAIKSSRAPGRIMSIAPLLQTVWDQPYPYNAMCPGGSVTGCVATAMAQILRYWSYPSHGHGSNFYWDEQAYSYQNNFGELSANYDTSNYIWSDMPDTITSANNEVAELMYDCGVSVDMDYGFESGAWVITGDYPVCTQVSFVKYFGYNPATIQGLYQSNFSIKSWDSLLENELNNGRPVQYVGWDSIQDETGHTWVCDGYDASGNFDMNWGWSGSDDGYFALNALDAGGYDFNWWNEALIGIEPPATSPYFVASPTFGCSSLNVQFTDQSVADNNLAVTSRSWLFPGGTPSASTETNPSVAYNTSGTYNVSEIISDAAGTDTLTRQAYISVASASSGSLEEDFQSPTFPPPGWIINNPNEYSYVWQLNTSVGGYGKSTQCMYFNNCEWSPDYAPPPPGVPGHNVIGERQQIYTPEYNYTTVTNPEIYFEVAYAPYSSAFSDTLVIYYSTDCGTTFTQIYSKGGATLSTTGNTIAGGIADTNSVGCFLPTGNEWRTDTIHIPAIAGAPGVMFSFENRSGNGSPIYIDNINIPVTPVNVPNFISNSSIKIFPNPNKGQFVIQYSGITGNPYVKIYNVLGQELYTTTLKNEDTPVNLSSEPSGVYIYRIFSESGSIVSTGRLVIE